MSWLRSTSVVMAFSPSWVCSQLRLEPQEVEQSPLAMHPHSRSEKYSAGCCDGAVSHTVLGAHHANAHTVPPPGACPGVVRGSRSTARSRLGPTTPTQRCGPGSCRSPTGGLPG